MHRPDRRPRTLAVAVVLLPAALAAAARAADGPAAPAYPGRYPFKLYGPLQEIPTAPIHVLEQDRDGFMWLGTENGLYRYDGRGTTRWGTREGLPSDWVISLARHPERGLWVGTSRGLIRFHDGMVEPARFGGTPLTFQVTGLKADTLGRLWCGSSRGPLRQSGPLDFEVLPGWPGGPCSQVALDPVRGSLWCDLGPGLMERRTDGTWRSWGAAEGLSGNPVGMLSFDGWGRLWAADGLHLYELEPGASSFRDRSAWVPAPVFARGGTPFLEANGSLWVPTARGVLILRRDGYEHLGADRGLPLSWVITGFMDRESNLWLTGSSLVKLNGNGKVTFFREADGLPSDLVWGVLRSRAGPLLAATQSGLARLDPGGWTRVPGTEGLMCYAEAEDGAGRVWVASPSQGLFYSVGGRERARWVVPSPPEAQFFALAADRSGQVWAGGTGGIHRVRPEGFTAELRAADLGLDTLGILGLSEDSAGRMWAASTEGLLCREGGRWRRFGPADGLRAKAMLGVSASPDGSVWAWYNEPLGATQARLEAGRLRVVRHLSQAEGLRSDIVYGVRDDGRGRLWVTSDAGIVLVTGSRIIHVSRGIPSEDCSANGLMLDAEGSLWTGTSGGLVRIDVSASEQSPPPPRTHLLEVEWDGTARDSAALPAAFPFRQTLQFRFSAPSFADEDDIRYQARLIGLEDEWLSVETRRTRYPALPGGRYRFEARAAFGNGEFGPPAAVDFRVRPPWWLSGWMLAAGVLVLGAGIQAIVRARTGRLAATKARLEGLVAQRTEELNSANEALKAQVLIDPLTGIHNRRYLMLTIRDESNGVLRRYRTAGGAAPLPNEDLVFLIVDLDRFKRVNDTYGHAVGDEALLRTADALRRSVRESDGVVRWGGEEFLILARATSRDKAPEIAERLRAAVAAVSLEAPGGGELRWTCSVGYAPFPFLPSDPGRLDWEKVLELADLCLYAAKRGGRDAWVGVEPGPGLDLERDGERLSSDLPGLVAEGRVEARSGLAEPFGARRHGPPRGHP